ncbi:FAD-binding oxidoreductase [Neobacillus sp. 114]|uniref:FAD-binding oxidoreductase n=1 Tax=Neobacillus sp. 114 TaxID=3048535 RepID=UPI001C22A11D|nr:FAD-binding oxidoreductase [Neobacillus sp. 114]MBU8917377.1 FAD-binding oxidoreductase [Bacillus sp. FJAT-29953]
MTPRKMKFWGWGYEDGLSPQVQYQVEAAMAKRFGVSDWKKTPPPAITEISLKQPRIHIPQSLQHLCTNDTHERLSHTYGKSYRDVVRAFRRDFTNAPDIVAFPRNDHELINILDWCNEIQAAVIIYGGGTSVVGGVEPEIDDRYSGSVSIDIRNFNQVLEVDKISRAARIQAGIRGPAIEKQLKEQDLTLRFFPQSFEFSTLGGWIATRAGGHFATLHTHIDDFVQSLRVITPKGVVETRRLPGSGAGPSPDRMFIGSEGTLGIITEAWVRLQDRPVYRTAASVRFPDFQSGVKAVRVLSQSGLYPSNCRLLDTGEAHDSGAGDGQTAVLMLGFESHDHLLDVWMIRALECCKEFGGVYGQDVIKTRSDSSASREGDVGTWRNAFIQAPYLRDVLVGLGIIVETFETAITWDRFEGFHTGVMEAAQKAVREISGHNGWVTCRITHVYPDGPAPYYTVKALGKPGSELEQWDEIKAAVSEAIISLGGTITHHHAVGRDHRPWYDKQRPDLFASALKSVKRTLDPGYILNPGVLID